MRREGNRLVAAFLDEYGRRRVERAADQIVVDHGATPVDDLYFALKPGSRNLGEVDQASLHRGAAADDRQQPRRRLSALSHRRRGGVAQHPRGDLRCAAACLCDVMRAHLGRDLKGRRGRRPSGGSASTPDHGTPSCQATGRAAPHEPRRLHHLRRHRRRRHGRQTPRRPRHAATDRRRRHRGRQGRRRDRAHPRARSRKPARPRGASSSTRKSSTASARPTSTSSSI